MNPADVEALARYASTLDAVALPADVLATAKACLLYGLAVGIATKRARPALLAAAASKVDDCGAGTTTRLLDGTRTSRANAVFANAVLLSGRVQGDSHPCGHIGGVIIPAALAAAEEANVSGRELLSAMVCGYEVALRIGRDHSSDLSKRGFRTTPCYGVFGAAAAASRIRRLGSKQMMNAIGCAANFAGGLREYVDAGTEESPFQAGFAARNGLYVADLAALDVSATPTALSGKAGFYAAFAAPATDYGRRIAQDLGTQFEFTNVTFKQYPACQFLRGIIKGIGNLRGQARGARPLRIELRMNPFEADFIGVTFNGPFTSPAQSVMSAPFCAAVAWVTGTANYASMREFDNPEVNGIIPKVAVIADASRACYAPLMTVALDDGRTLTWQEKEGDAAYRLSWTAAVEMTRQLCDEVAVPGATASALVDCVAGVEELRELRALITAVCDATRAP